MKTFKASLLVESSIGIFLIGIVLALSIQYWKVINYEKNLFITEQRIHNIKIALEGYVMRYGFLPNASNNNNGDSTTGCIIGKIPYKTLGLSKDHLKDGFGNLLQFIVNENLTLEYHLKKGKKIVPIFFPTIYIYNDNIVSWHRIYSFSQEYQIFDYEEIDEIRNINLYKNGKLIELDYLECDHPILPRMIKESSSINFEKYNKNYKVNDLVAWVIVYGKSKQITSLKIEVKDNVYFQTRFNLAAMIKSSTDINATYLDYVSNNSFKFKE